ncbi:MAG: hypothetical protein EOO28_20150 [Comamonadaceae bacterium]|nr:MAG: hypothetical protein EOO28_20150 [Comamonadaceae bacterium]
MENTLSQRAANLLFGIVLLAATGSAFAQTTPDSSAEVAATTGATGDEVRPEVKNLLPNGKLVGKGRLTVWGFQVYDALLWALPGFRNDKIAAQPFALELAYLRAFDKEDIAERSIVEMRRAQAITDAQAQAWTAEMVRVLPNVKKGDRVVGVNRPGVGAQFFNNGKLGGEIRDPEFARLFFSIWLGPKTSEPELRSALLAGAS